MSSLRIGNRLPLLIWLLVWVKVELCLIGEKPFLSTSLSTLIACLSPSHPSKLRILQSPMTCLAILLLPARQSPPHTRHSLLWASRVLGIVMYSVELNHRSYICLVVFWDDTWDTDVPAIISELTAI